jgi:hypothetical protein
VRDPITDDAGQVKAHSIKQWLLAEGSLTHTPAEPRNQAGAVAVVAPALTSVKSLLGNYGSYSWEYECDYQSDWDPAQNMGAAAADVLTYRLEKACRNIIGDDAMAPAEQITAISGCFDEAKGLLTSLVNALASVGESASEADVTESVKSAFLKYVPAGEMPGSLPAPSALSLAEQADQVLTAVTAYTKRAGEVQALRSRSGQSLPASHADVAAKSVAALEALKARISGKSLPVPVPAPPAGEAPAPAQETPVSDPLSPPAPLSPAEPIVVVEAESPETKTATAEAVSAALERARKLGVNL